MGDIAAIGQHITMVRRQIEECYTSFPVVCRTCEHGMGVLRAFLFYICHFCCKVRRQQLCLEVSLHIMGIIDKRQFRQALMECRIQKWMRQNSAHGILAIGDKLGSKVLILCAGAHKCYVIYAFTCAATEVCSFLQC